MAEISRQEKTKYRLADSMKECMKDIRLERVLLRSLNFW